MLQSFTKIKINKNKNHNNSNYNNKKTDKVNSIPYKHLPSMLQKQIQSSGAEKLFIVDYSR